jgi:hypothetical protein
MGHHFGSYQWWVQEYNSSSWEPEEDAKLTEAVKKYGKVWYWTAIAAMVPGRNDQQCRKRWLKRLDPDRTANTVEEDPERR